MTALPQQESISEEEYWAIDEGAERKYEYFKGEMFAMAGGTPRHAQVIANTIIAVGARLRGKSCYPTSSDQRVKIEATGLQTYPDLAIVCPPPRYDSHNANTLLNPRVLFEVLSPTTERYDRTVKLNHYQQIAELTDIVLVDPDRIRVEHFRRQSDGWLYRTYVRRADSLLLILAEGPLELPLEELYERLEAPEGLELISEGSALQEID